MDKNQLYTNFINSVEAYRLSHNISQKIMADSLDMSLTSYKSLIKGDSVNISMYSLYLACEKMGISAIEIMGGSDEESQIMQTFHSLPDHRKKALATILRIEQELDNSAKLKYGCESTTTSCYIPTGNIEDGMLYDSRNIVTLDVTSYVSQCPDTIDCAIMINSNHLHPVYHMDDVLLIHQSAPRDGDTGIFIHKPTRKLYIRRFRQTDPCQLIPINGIGKTIYVDSHNLNEMNQWIKFGRVMMRVKSVN